MRQYTHFVLWRYEYDADADPGTDPAKRWRKVPIQAHNGGHRASSTNPKTWTTYAKAVAVYQRIATQQPGTVGMGFIFAKVAARYGLIKPRDADDLTFVDLDHCRDPQTGETAAWALDYLRQAGTYAEVSPSGTGYHLYGQACGRGPFKVGAVELYEVARFATLTGQHVESTPDDCQPCQPFIDDLARRLDEERASRNGATHQPVDRSAVKRLTLSDKDLLKRARLAKNGDKFRQLFDVGRWSPDYPSQSEAVYALLRLLAFWSQCDGELMDRWFRQSALMSGTWVDKWDDPRGNTTLGALQIAKIIEDPTQEVYGQSGLNDAFADEEPEAVGVALRRVADIDERPVHWLWPGYVPLGKVTLLDGSPDLGKTTLLLHLAARLSTGDYLPLSAERYEEGPINIIVASTEDDAADTLRPRLRVAGADLARVWVLDGVTLKDGAARPLSIPQDVAVLSKAITEQQAALLIIDPLFGYLDGRANTRDDRDVRQALAPLHALANDSGCAVVVVRHFKKDSSETNPLHRGGGSIGIIATARHGLAVVSANEKDHPNRRMLGVSKHNLAPEGTPTLAYELDSAQTTIQDKAVSLPVVRWIGTDARSIEDLLSEAVIDSKPEVKRATRDGYDVIEQVMGDNEWHKSEDMDKEMADHGISDATWRRCRTELERRNRMVKQKVPAVRANPATGAQATAAYWAWKLLPPATDGKED